MARKKRNPGDLAAHVRKRVRALREARELTREQLCEAAGLSLDAVSRIEAGTRTPTLDTLAKLAAALRVTAAELLADEDVAPDLPAPVAKMAAMTAAREPAVQRGVERVVSAFLKSVDEVTRS